MNSPGDESEQHVVATIDSHGAHRCRRSTVWNRHNRDLRIAQPGEAQENLEQLPVEPPRRWLPYGGVFISCVQWTSASGFVNMNPWRANHDLMNEMVDIGAGSVVLCGGVFENELLPL
jgi:hypothetical protein